MFIFLLVLMIVAHKIISIPLWETNSTLCCQIIKFRVLWPVLLSVWVPIHSKFLYLKHWKWLLLLDFIIDVQKSSLKTIVGHWISDGLSHKAKVKSLVTAANFSVFKPDMNVSNTNSQIFIDYTCETTHITLVSIVLSLCFKISLNWILK